MKFFLLTLFIIPQILASTDIFVQDRINTKKYYREVYPIIFGNPNFGLDDNFVKAVNGHKDKKTIKKFIGQLDAYFPYQILKALTYYTYLEPNQNAIFETLKFAALSNFLILRDNIDDPLSSEKFSSGNLLKKLSWNQSKNTDLIFQTNEKAMDPQFKTLTQMISSESDNKSFIAAIKSTPIFATDFQKEIPNITPYSLSYLGFIKGNKTELISRNAIDNERIEWFNQRAIFNLSPGNQPLDFSLDYMKMPLAAKPAGHPSFREDPIFTRIRDMIIGAHESIFIDIFLFGGTMGGTLAKFLLDQTMLKFKENPNFKLIIIHDYATNYNMYDEIMPVFHYIKKRIIAEGIDGTSAALLQANIQRHPPGVPFGITKLLPKTDALFKEIEKRNTYYESKIDHSKVIVVDANSDTPKAYFGSKNWSDHSGGYYFDNAIYVEGPAAAIVQASYQDDVIAALTQDPDELKWFYYKDQGLDNVRYKEVAGNIINWMNVKDKYPSLKETPINDHNSADDIVRFAEADVDGTVKNFRNILIDMIKKAKDHIYMEQLFIYDPYVVDALIKKKILNPTLDIKILADHNGNFGFNGLPNTIYMKEMIAYGIKIKARDTDPDGFVAKFQNGKTQTYHQENHRKITSVDSKVLLGGSSNINPDTLQGSFREFGAQIYNKKAIELFESSFLADWNGETKLTTSVLAMDNFQATIGKQSLSVDLSALINDIGAFIFRSKDKLEKRY